MPNNQDKIKIYFKRFLRGEKKFYLNVFLSFLKATNSLEEFLYERSRIGEEDFKIFDYISVECEGAGSFLMEAFPFSETKSGYSYWFELNRKWHTICYLIKNNGYYQACHILSVWRREYLDREK